MMHEICLTIFVSPHLIQRQRTGLPELLFFILFLAVLNYILLSVSRPLYLSLMSFLVVIFSLNSSYEISVFPVFNYWIEVRDKMIVKFIIQPNLNKIEIFFKVFNTFSNFTWIIFYFKFKKTRMSILNGLETFSSFNICFFNTNFVELFIPIIILCACLSSSLAGLLFLFLISITTTNISKNIISTRIIN